MSDLKEIIKLYFSKNLLIVFLMGIVSGLPLYLILSTLAIWLTRENIDLSTIGLFSLTQIPWTVKFLWAPILDNYKIPYLTNNFGRRKSWLMVIQFFLSISVILLGINNPAGTILVNFLETDLIINQIYLTALFALFVSFFSASQDIVIDAYRIEILKESEQGAGAAMTQAGYRIGGIISGAGALYLREYISWELVFISLGLIILLFFLITIFLPDTVKEKTRDAGARDYFNPLKEFIFRVNFRRVLLLLLFIFSFKLCDAVAGVMANPFYVKIGFTNIEIANASKILGIFATIIGVFIGGIFVKYYGILNALLISGFLQMLSNLLFFFLSEIGPNYNFLLITVLGENISGGLGSAAFVAYLSRLCNLNYTATQYALLSSFMGIARTFVASPSGFFVEIMGWSSFFLFSTFFALPGLLILFWMKRKFPLKSQVAN